MELRQLRYFVAVAEELHFGHAAERLHLSQQSLSFQIKQLEEEVGAALFERTTRSVELTAAGHALLDEVHIAFDHLQRGIDNAQRAGRGEVGRLVLGYISTTLYNVLPPSVRLFRERYPDVEIVLKEMVSPSLEEDILSGEVDVALLVISGKIDINLAYCVIHRETSSVALPKGHPLEILDAVPFNLLANEPFVMYSRIHKRQSYDQLIARCQNSGFSPKIVQEAATESAVIGLVAAGVGIAITAESLGSVRSDEVVYRPLIDPVIEIPFAVAWRQHNTSPLVKAFVEIARESMADMFQKVNVADI